MKNQLIAAFLFAAIFGGMLLAVGCQPPGVTQGTIEVNYVSSGCPVTVNVDGSQSQGFSSNAQFFTFPHTVAPGNHTLNFSTGGNCGSNCLVNGSANYPLTFYVGGGDVYEANVSEGGSCDNIQVSGS